MTASVTVTKPSQAIVPAHTTRVFGPGQVCLDAPAGAVVLVRHATLPAKLIRTFERLRVPKPYCWTNHAGVTLSAGSNAQIIQEGGRGAAVSLLANLVAETYTVTTIEAMAEQKTAGVVFLAKTIGTGYGWLSIVADAFNALTGLELSLATGERMVCSTQTARYMERIGYVPEHSPYSLTPAHLAWALGIVNPLAPPPVNP
jgi:hypothetical protein